MSTSARVTFDLEKGRVDLVHRDEPGTLPDSGSATGGSESGHAHEDSARMVVVPAAALARLLAAAKDEGVAVGRALGEAIGTRIGPSYDADTSVDRGLSSIADELGLFGLGAISLEKWGRALIVAVDEPADVPDEFLAAVIEGTLAKATSRELRARSLGRNAGRLRVFVGRPATVERLSKWLGEGVGWGDALVRLHDAEAKA